MPLSNFDKKTQEDLREKYEQNQASVLVYNDTSIINENGKVTEVKEEFVKDMNNYKPLRKIVEKNGTPQEDGNAKYLFKDGLMLITSKGEKFVGGTLEYDGKICNTIDSDGNGSIELIKTDKDYEKFDIKNKTHREIVKKYTNIADTLIVQYSPKTDTIDDVVKSILAFGGIGILFSLISKPTVISAQNVQLAPPFPNLMIYFFIAMLIGGTSYFLVKKFKK
jgi:hypothetical protein